MGASGPRRVTPRYVGELGTLKPPTSYTLVTIVTPTIGRPDILHAIESVKSQSHKQIEHIIVADGVDAAYRCPVRPTVALGHKWSTARTGPGGYATNVGWLLGHGDYLYTLPDDDWLEPDCIERFIAEIGAHDFAWSQVEFSTPRGTGCFSDSAPKSWVTGDANQFDGNHATPDQFFHRRLLQWGMYFATDHWQVTQPGHDIDLLRAWQLAGASGVYVPGVLAHHTVNH